MSFIQFFRILWARRWIVIAATVSCFIAAVAIGSLLPTRYTSTSRVMLDIVKPDPVTGQVMNTQFARTFFTTQAELIKDYRVAGRVVDNLGWTSSPELLRQYNGRAPGDNRDFRRWLAQLVMDGTQVKMIDGSNILEISYTGNNPQSAAAVADALRDAYNEESLAFKRQSAADTAGWLDQQVVKTRDSLIATEARKASFERQNNIVLGDDATDMESARLRALASAPEAPNLALSSAAAAATKMQLAQIDAKITSTAETLGPNHPDLQDLRRQRDAIASAAAAEQRALPSGPTGPSLEGQVRAQQARVLNQRDKVEQLRRMQTDVAVLRDQYARTAQKAAEARQQADSNDTGLTFMGSAVTPTDPVFPNWPLILFGSLGLGLALGIMAALITELLSRRVRGVEDLTMIDAPVIAVLQPVRSAGALTGPRRLLPFLPSPATA